MNLGYFAFFCTVKSGWEGDDYLALFIYTALLVLLFFVHIKLKRRLTKTWQQIMRWLVFLPVAFTLIALICLVVWLAPC